MSNLTPGQKLHFVLRLAVAMCFIGHGAFGIITKPIWANYFAVFGIGKAMAFKLMPVLGSVDVLLGLIMLVKPLRGIALWLVIWGVITASLRPLSGEPFAELIERAGNFGAPLALLILSGGVWTGFKDLFKPLDPNIQPDKETLKRVTIALRIIVFLLLAGHGWLNLIGKKGLMSQYTSLGSSNPVLTGKIVGAFEIAMGILLLIKPFRPVILALLIWKIASELFYPHYEVFEWIERGGSYCCLLALWLVTKQSVFLGLHVVRPNATASS
jgi:hypothetical protein